MRCVIVGGDAAGMSAASQIRRQRPEWSITVLEKGRFTSYAACGIPYAVAGDVESIRDLEVFPAERFRQERRIDVRTSTEATAIDLGARTLRLAHEGGEETIGWDRLLLATGALPIVPPWPGRELQGVVVVRNLEDLARLTSLLEQGPRRAVVVGGGYVGLEMAEALARRGLEVAVVERADGVMGGLDPHITELVQEEMAGRCDLRLSTTVTGFEGHGGVLRAVTTDAGPLEADLAVVALGVRPNVELARAAGISLGETGAVAVDAHQRTSAPDVFAAGDCAEALHRVTGRPAWVPLALTANRQGRVAGVCMADGDATFPGIVGSAVTRVCELAIARTGLDSAAAARAGIQTQSVEASGTDRAHYIRGHQAVWIKLVFRADDRRLVGALLAGRDAALGKRCDVLATAITAGMTVDDVADLDLCYAPPFAPVWDPILRAANKAAFAG